MRTLKKTLSLVLALVLCLGLVGSAFAVNLEKYTDGDQVGAIYAEAADVMLGLGVITGMTTTEIGATGTLTREQAAKIIAYLVLGKTAADALSANAAPFDDVEATRWSAGYIAYCAQNGILGGYGDGNFGPADELQGYQFAKMLLCALGYGKAGEYNVGESWSIVVAQEAIPMGIFTGDLSAAVNAPITRQQAMLMAFNCRNLPTVRYLDVLGIYQNVEVAGTPVVLYAFNGLAAATGTNRDDFGRVLKVWNKNSVKIAEVAVAPTKTYTTAVSGAKIFADLGLKANIDNVNVYTDGKANLTSTFDVNYTNVATTVGGNGAVTEVYYDAVAGTIEIVVINTYFDTVASVTPATAVAKEYVTLTDGTFVISGLKANDAVLYTKATTATTPSTVTVIKSVKAVAPTTLAATSYTATNFVANGTTYTYSAQMAAAQEIDALIAPFAPVKVYFDNYGYVIATAGVEAAAPNYAVVLTTTSVPAVWPATGSTNKAQVVKADGTVAIFDNVKDITNLVKGDIVTYADGTGADTGKIVLTEVAAMQSPAASFAATKGTVAVTGGKANSKTIFVVETLAPVTSIPSYTAYVGIANVPTITGSTNYALYDNTVPSADGYADIVFVQAATLYAAPTTANDVIYVDASSKVNHTTATGSYSVYNAVVNGVPTTINTVADYFSADGLYGKVTKNAAGLISAATALHNPTAGIVVVDTPVTGTTAALNGVVKLGSAELTYTETTQVYKVTPAGITASSVAAITTDVNDTVVYYTVGGVLAAAYITVVA